jgi:hypothetical protein
MTGRTLQRWLCRLGQTIAPADMRDWAEGMTREIEEIDDERAALEWAAACFLSCGAQRVRAVLRIAATAARFLLGGYCLVSCGQIVIKSVRLVSEGRTTVGLTAFWLFVALLLAATAALVALRRRAAAWTMGAVTAALAVNFTFNLAGLSGEALSQEIVAAYTMFGLLLGLTAAAFWLTRRPDADLTI